MIIKFLSKEYPIKIDDLSEQTIGGLKEMIKQVIEPCSSKSDDKILLFHNKVKLSGDSSTPLDSFEITDKSIIFVVSVPGQQAKPEEKKGEQQTKSTPHHQQTPQSFPQMKMPMGEGMQDPNSFQAKYLEQMLENPDAMMQAMEQAMPNMSEDQKAFFRQQIEIIKNNPELLNQVLNNPMMMNAMRNPYGGGGMPPMMGSPMMYNNPYAMGGYNPWMMSPNMHPMMDQPRAEGPCSHGFYPPKYVNGVPEPQNAKDVWKNQLDSLNEMGFTNEEENIQALKKSKGDIYKAIDYLGGNLKE